MKCTESEDESPSFSKENFLQLSCFISQEVKYMLSGIKSVRKTIRMLKSVYNLKITKINSFQKLQEQLTKQSLTLGRDAVYARTVNFKSKYLGI